MSHRLTITLSDEEYALLKRESERSGVPPPELVRRAIANLCRLRKRQEIDGFEASFGLWRDRDFDGVEYVKGLRGPGLGDRLERDGRL